MVTGNGDLQRARKLLKKLQKNVETRQETRLIGHPLLELKALRDQIEGEIDLLILRRAYPGQCHLCSV